jgi:hypothetical protein
MLAKIPVGRRYSELPKGFTTFRHEDGRKPRSDVPANGRTTEVQSPCTAGPPGGGDYRATEHALKGPRARRDGRGRRRGSGRHDWLRAGRVAPLVEPHLPPSSLIGR